ncbi:MAG: hypothetical protein ABIQ04_04760 [Candidatus Saccharimonadales bacterium]
MNSMPSHDTQAPYFEDVLGELCDTAARSGSVFTYSSDVQHVDGSYDVSRVLPEFALDPIEHSSDFVEDILDRNGGIEKAVTTYSSLRADYTQYTPLRRLMSELPEEYLVFPAQKPSQGSTASATYAQPIGIKLNAIPNVTAIVNAAYTQIPKGEKYYPSGVMVLDGQYKQQLLTLFQRVLAPPVTKPAIIPVGVITPAPSPVPLPPKQEIPHVIAESSPQVVLAPKERRIRLVSKLASYGLIAISGGAAVETFYSALSDSCAQALGGIAIAAASGVGALFAHDRSVGYWK